MPSPARIRSTIATLTSPAGRPPARSRSSTRPWRTRRACASSSAWPQGEGTVTDLMRHVDLSQPLVSWHLRRLRAAGLVETRRSGREVICSLSRDALRRFHDDEHELLGLAS